MRQWFDQRFQDIAREVAEKHRLIFHDGTLYGQGGGFGEIVPISEILESVRKFRGLASLYDGRARLDD